MVALIITLNTKSHDPLSKFLRDVGCRVQGLGFGV